MPVSKKLKALYLGFWEKPELFVANLISDFQQNRTVNKYRDKKFKLSKEQKKQIKEYWKPYGRISAKWCAYYCSQNGIFDPAYIPNTLYFTKIDQYFNDRKLGWGFNDKNYYEMLFPNVTQPVTLVHKTGTLLFDKDYCIIQPDEALRIIKSETEIIVKPTQETGSGRSIQFLKTADDEAKILELLTNKKEKHLIFQCILRQHKDIAAIYPHSLNTVRVMTVLLDDGVHVLSSVFRMGANSSRVDNASNGGVSVGINSDGTLKKYGHILYKGTAVDRHPQGFVFEGFKIPEYGKLIDTVKLLAQRIGNFRLVSWDMSVDENGDIVLIEANMRKGGLAIQQFNNGPVFGDLTKRILDEVMKKK